MSEELQIPLFPLDSVVLFPSVQVPLYIFEPRYRQMTAAALEGDGRIGMVAVQPQHRDQMSSDPPVFAIGCAGEIRHSEPREDGTYQIVLHGTHRFRIRNEVPKEDGRLYRVAVIETIDDPDVDPRDPLRPARDRVLELMRSLVPARSDRFEPEAFTRLDDATFVDTFCQSLDFSVLEKQQLLESNGVRARAAQLISLMEFRLAEQSTSGSSGSESVH
jgi:Lon protease-like protein